MLRILLACAGLLAAVPSASADELLFDQPWTSTFASPTSAFVPSLSIDLEVADDFDLTGSVGRLMVTGNDCGSCPSAQVLGVYVRFWEWTPTGPGALQQETFLPAGDPGFLHDSAAPDLLDITLPVPFEATGQHFVSVQMSLGNWYLWGWWLSNRLTPSGSTLLVRDASAGDTWGPFVDSLGNDLVADAAFQLWSGDTTPLDPGTDPCGDWVEMPSPDPDEFIDVFLSGLAVVGADDAWAVGTATKAAGGSTDHFTVAMHWDGSDWSLVDSPSPALFPGPGGTDAALAAADATGPDDIWAAGSATAQNLAGFSGTQILVLHWDGTSWTEVAAPNSWVGSGNFVSSVEALAQDDVWFVGDWLAGGLDGGAPIRAALAMQWDGSGFTIHETPYPPLGGAGVGLNAIDALAPDDIWAVGGGHDGDMAPFPYIVHWDGSSWTQVLADATPGTLYNLYSVEAIAPDDVWASGGSFDGFSGSSLLLHWDGSDWTEVDSPAAGAVLHEASPGEMYALKADRILRDDGLGWTQVMDFSPEPGVGLGTIASAGGDCGSLWVAGIESVVGEMQPFTAHLVPDGAFIDLGAALAGSAGMPSLTGDGSLLGGDPTTLSLSDVLPGAPAWFVLGASALNAPFKGGTLVPSLDVLLPLTVDAQGEIVFSFAWPSGVPSGVSLYYQYWIQDPVGMFGFSASNGLQSTTP